MSTPQATSHRATPSSASSLSSLSASPPISESSVSIASTSDEATAAATRALGRPTNRRKKSARDRMLQARKLHEQSRLYNLTLDVHNLKQEIRQLQIHQGLLQDRAQREAPTPRRLRTLAAILYQYFHGFQYGLRADDATHCAFVRSIVSEQFTIGATAYGVDMLLEQWRRYTVVFAIHTVKLKTFTPVMVDAEVVFQCATEFHGVFTRLAVDTVFPNARTALWPLLHALGAALICPMRFHLYFDRQGKLVRHDLEADFVSAIGNLPGGDAVGFLDNARVGDESMIGPPQY